MPTVSLYNQLITVVSVGVPIGIGTYLAWVHRDRADRTKIEGFGAALVGVLIGAWLGFHVISGLLAVITTIVGAAVAANLSLIVYDIWRERTAEEGVYVETTSPLMTPEARA